MSSLLDLKKSLHCIFGQFGPILDVVCKKTYRLRGQAWVVFENSQDAAEALKLMQGFPFFDRPIRISISHTKSDANAKKDGTYDENAVEKRKEDSIRKREAYFERVKARQMTGGAAVSRLPGAAPNKILFLENLPETSTQEMIAKLFEQYGGFKEVRLVPGRPGIAFVEYDTEVAASVAMQGVQGFKLTEDKAMKISFAKQG